MGVVVYVQPNAQVDISRRPVEAKPLSRAYPTHSLACLDGKGALTIVLVKQSHLHGER